MIKSLSFIYNIDGGVNELHVSENQEEEEEEGGDDDDLEEGDQRSTSDCCTATCLGHIWQ